jgi:cell division protein FtsZ
VPGPGEIATFVAVVIALLLILRIVAAATAWVRHTRTPEARAIRVIGVGGGGGNAVDRMVAARVRGVGFVACNTDAQALRRSLATTRIRIGNAITGGLGSGGDPEIGRRAAEEDRERISRAVAGADLVFVTAGLGGGTGSGAAPIVAAAAKERGALTIGVVTKPFEFEGSQRERIAETAAAELATTVDALIVIPNERVSDVLPEDTTMIEAFAAVDDVLLHAVKGIIDLITAPGMINLDFADIRAVMQDAGHALIGLGHGSGEQRAADAARQAVTSPLLEASIDGARGILFNIAGPADLGLREVRAAAEEIRKHADADANVIFGTSLGRSRGDEVLITLIATGLADRAGRPRPARARAEPATVEAPPPELSRRDEPSRPVAPISRAEPLPQAEPVPQAAPMARPESSRPPKRPTRPVRPRSGIDADHLADDTVTAHLEAREATPEVTKRNGAPEPDLVEEINLDVPSFLRRNGRPSNR